MEFNFWIFSRYTALCVAGDSYFTETRFLVQRLTSFTNNTQSLLTYKFMRQN